MILISRGAGVRGLLVYPAFPVGRCSGLSAVVRLRCGAAVDGVRWCCATMQAMHQPRASGWVSAGRVVVEGGSGGQRCSRSCGAEWRRARRHVRGRPVLPRRAADCGRWRRTAPKPSWRRSALRAYVPAGQDIRAIPPEEQRDVIPQRKVVGKHGYSCTAAPPKDEYWHLDDTARQWWWPCRRVSTGVASGRVHCGAGRLVGPQVAFPSASEHQDCSEGLLPSGQPSGLSSHASPRP